MNIRSAGLRTRSNVYLKYHRGPNHAMKVRMERWMRRVLGLRRVITQSPYGVRFAAEYGDYVQMELIRWGQYEPLTLSRFQELLRPGDTFVDVGAHVGQYALHAAQLVGKSGKVIAFEPNRRAHGFLLDNISLNDASNVIAVCGAIAERSCVLDLTYGDDFNWGAAHRAVGESAGVVQHAIAGPLRELLMSLGAQRIDALKIDVEGMETEVLRSLFASNGKLNPRHILLELIPEALLSQGSSREDLLALLHEYGYSLRSIDGAAYDPMGGLAENNLWATLDR